MESSSDKERQLDFRFSNCGLLQVPACIDYDANVPSVASLFETSAMVPYVLLDTNILFRYVTQGEPGCEPEHFDALVIFVKSGTVKLFDSEVVELEFKAQCKGLEDGLKSEIKRIEEHVLTGMKSSISEFFLTGKKKAWNEIKDLHPWLENESKSFSDRIKAWSEEKFLKAKTRMETVRNLMLLPIVERLAFDENNIFRTKRRFLEKRYKQAEGSPKPESDYNIVDSIVRFFESSSPQPVMFCSENTTDLAIEIDSQQFLHPFVKDDLPVGSGLFLSLANLVGFLRDQKPLKEPSAEKIQEAVEREVTTSTFNQEPFYRLKIAINGKVRLFQTIQGATFTSDSLSRQKLAHLIMLMQTVLQIAGENPIRPSQLRDALEAVVTVSNQFRSQTFAQRDGLFMDIEALIAECSQMSDSLPVGDQHLNRLKPDE
jgi:hypothetical protein